MTLSLKGIEIEHVTPVMMILKEKEKKAPVMKAERVFGTYI